MWKNIKVVLIRHTETEWIRKWLRLWENDSLTKIWIQQAINLKNHIDIMNYDFIYTSTSKRSKETMIYSLEINTKNINYKELDLLKERKEATSFIWKKTLDLPWNIIRKNRNKKDWKYEDWESFSDIYNRTSEILNFFSQHEYNKNILVYTHWSIIRSIIIYIIFNWKVSPWKYFRLTEIFKIIPWWITEIIYSKENYENKFSWKIKYWMAPVDFIL